MANTRWRRTVQEYALLQCGEFFRDEMLLGAQSERLAQKYAELRKLCFDALDEPSIADADEIRMRYIDLMGQQIEYETGVTR